MEAVTDTQKGGNYIVTEYLAKNGVDMTEVTKGLRSPMSAASDPEAHVRNVVADPSATAEELQSPMDAASDPRDTSETLADLPSADTTVPQQDGQVNVKKAGESVENAALRGTYGLEKAGRTAQQSKTNRRCKHSGSDTKRHQNRF